MEHLTGAKSSSLSKIRLMRVSVKRGVGVGVGAGFWVYLSYFLFIFFSKNAVVGLGLTLTLTQILAPHFTDTRLVPCERSLRPHISKTLSSIFFVKFRKRLISSLKKRHTIEAFNPFIPSEIFPQSRNPDGYFRLTVSLAYFQSRISPLFGLKMLKRGVQIREIQDPEKPGDWGPSK